MKIVGFDEVVRLAEARGCTVKRLSAVSVEMRGPGGNTATCNSADGENKLWTTTAVFVACRDARLSPTSRSRAGTPDAPAGLDVKQYGLHEHLIAAAMVADGVWAYRDKQRTAALETLLRCSHGEELHWADNKPAIRNAVRAVVDAGLASLVMGPNGGWSRAKVQWLPAAKITDLEAEDHDAASSLG
ncbi:MAG: hypothetical protein JWR80_6525 [Bradyrhizobium sp.]|nr:hypothetical protein [Bradyrhizobium sp.]